MPIVQAFSPTTGAAIGGGDGPPQVASLYNQPLTEINLTDGSWTLLDPDSSLKSVSFSGGFNTITLNARVASVDNRWAGGTDCTMPRWYKDFQISGNDVTVDDITQFIARLEEDLVGSGTNFNKSFIVGICNDPTSNTLLTIRGNGAYMNRSGGGNVAYGTWQQNSSTSSSASVPKHGLTSVLRGYNSMGYGAYINVDPAEAQAARNSGSRNSNVNDTGAADSTVLKVIVAPGARGNSDAIPQDAVYKIRAHIAGINWSKTI